MSEQLPPIFKWFVEGKFAASGFPADQGQLQATSKQGIKHIVAVTSREPDAATIQQLGMSVEHVPGITKDVQALDKAVESLHSAAMAGKTCLVH
jgi:hypothetical protein